MSKVKLNPFPSTHCNLSRTRRHILLPTRSLHHSLITSIAWSNRDRTPHSEAHDTRSMAVQATLTLMGSSLEVQGLIAMIWLWIRCIPCKSRANSSSEWKEQTTKSLITRAKLRNGQAWVCLQNRRSRLSSATGRSKTGFPLRQGKKRSLVSGCDSDQWTATNETQAWLQAAIEASARLKTTSSTTSWHLWGKNP